MIKIGLAIKKYKRSELANSTSDVEGVPLSYSSVSSHRELSDSKQPFTPKILLGSVQLMPAVLPQVSMVS